MAAMVDEWARAGVSHAVVCPGSRSTPLALALAGDRRMAVHVRLDERSAAFTALGVGLAGGGPAVLCTTSGTAAAEVHAAVVEAHHAQVPLLVCTADRPPELHDVGAPQTVAQRGLYPGVLRWAADPGVAEAAIAGTWRSLAARAVSEARHHPAGPGPVHLNLAFREPLVGRPTMVPDGRPGGAPWHDGGAARDPAPPAVADDLRVLGLDPAGGHGWVPGVVVAGAGCGPPAAVAALAAALGWPVLADPRSGCRRPEVPTVVAAADAILRAGPAAAALAPRAVLRLGRPWVSRVVAQWLDSLGPDVPQLLVSPGWTWDDPGRATARSRSVDPAAWCQAAASQLSAGGGSAGGGSAGGGSTGGAGWVDRRWAARWDGAEAAARQTLASWMAAHPEATEPGVARTVLDSAPAGVTVLLGSSMPVRDAEWFGPVRAGHPEVVANRGANGIDGVVSTALGVALTGRPVVALVGDLAFLHDLTAWVRPPGAEPDCLVVVVDNAGGGIFSFLPQAADVPADVFTTLFTTPQVVDVAAVATGLGLAVTEADDLATVSAAVASVEGNGLRVLRVRVPGGEANVRLHDELHRAVAGAVARSLAGGEVPGGSA